MATGDEVKSLLDEGRRYISARDYPNARRTLSEALSAASTSETSLGVLVADILWSLAAASLESLVEPGPKLTEALDLQRRAIEHAESTDCYPASGVAVFLYKHAALLRCDGREEEAAHHFYRSIAVLLKLGEGTRQQRFELASCLLALGRPVDAITELRQVVEVDQQAGRVSIPALYLLADALRHVDANEARSVIGRLLDSNSTSGHNFSRLRETARRWLSDLD